MRRFGAFLVPLLLTVGQANAGERLGPLPPQPVSRSSAGPSDELIGFLAFDPTGLAGKLPRGTRFLTLAEKARGWPYLEHYLENHPERRGWAWSIYEIIGIRNAAYDRVGANFDGGRGGMAVWYPELARVDGSDPRMLGTQNLALGSWISDPKLEAYIRSRGYPAARGTVAFRRTAQSVSARFEAQDLSISGGCRLEGKSFVPNWAKTPLSYETMWTPAGEGDTFEVVTWAGHRVRACVDPSWKVSGSHPFALAFNDPARGDPNIFRTEFAFGYQLRSGLYRR